MRFYFLFFIFVFFISFVSAGLNIDKGHLDYDLKIGEEKCLMVSLSSEDYYGVITLKDSWAKDIKEGTNINKYNLSASVLGLSLDYPKEIQDFSDKKEVRVCILGNRSGNYRGAMIFTPDSNTNVVVEIGTWLLVYIKEDFQESSDNSESSSSSGGGGSSSGGGSSGIQSTKNSEEENSSILSNENESPNQENSKITGSAVSELSNVNKPIISTIIIIFALIAIFFYIKRKK